MKLRGVLFIGLSILAIGAPSSRADGLAPIQKDPLRFGSPIVDAASPQIRPRIAFDQRAGRALVVWEDDSVPTAARVYGRILLGDGTPAGVPFLISTSGANSHTVPMVVSSETRDEFLVIWQYAYGPTDMDVYARLVSSDGILITETLYLAVTGTPETNPSAAYNVNLDEYLVVFEYRSSPDLSAPADIAALRVAGNGASSAPMFLPVGSTAAYDLSPRVAYGYVSQKYALVWTQGAQDAVSLQPYAVGLDRDGTPIGQPNILVYADKLGYLPDIVWNGVKDTFLAVWELRYPPGYASIIQGAFLRYDGTPYYGPADLSGTLPGNCLRPSVTCSGLTGEFLVPFEYEYSPGDHDVLARRVDQTGARPDPPFAISDGVAWESGPAVAWGWQSGYFLAWEDSRNSATAPDIYGGTTDFPAFAGLVTEGEVDDPGPPLQDAQVFLRGLNAPWPDTTTAVWLTQAMTNDEGSYVVPVYGTFPYYVLQARPPFGYQVAGARSQYGSVLAVDLIQHTAPAGPGLIQGDTFWMINPLSGVTPPESGGPLRVIGSWPNPMSGSYCIQLGGRGTEACRVQVFDSGGRLLRLLVPGGRSHAAVEWDGRIAGGAPAPNGTYFLRVIGPEGEVTTKVTLVR
jgi:hypothetical protein